MEKRKFLIIHGTEVLKEKLKTVIRLYPEMKRKHLYAAIVNRGCEEMIKSVKQNGQH